ncbi:MAG: hypothetical protein KA715_05145 [Xanthomonadaceae bacterium]|nr:hypothetical protein [Xanthomonadaceae bacterium]
MVEVKNTIRWVINAWDVPAHQVGPTFDHLMQKGLLSFVTFVPWQGVENDISRVFTRFLQHAYERRLNVKLVVTPELGMTYPWCGVPKELALDSTHQAKSKLHGEINILTPNVNFNLPSLYSAEFQKRYFSFLVRFESMLKDFCDLNPGAAQHLTVSVGGSFFKYYRSAVASTYQDFGTEAGDYSLSADLEFRKYLEQRHDPLSRKKQRGSESAQYRSFQRYFEELFRTKIQQLFIKRNPGWKLEQLECFTPELDPVFHMENFWAHTLKKPMDLFKLGHYLTSAFSRRSRWAGVNSQPTLFWTESSHYGQNTPARKQNAFFQSFMTTVSADGELWISPEDWFSFSESFRDRIELISKQSQNEEWRTRDQIYVLTPHLWSTEKSIQLILDQLSELGWKQGVRFVQDLYEIPESIRPFFILIDPDYEFSEVQSSELLSKVRRSHSVWFMSEDSLADPSLATHQHAIHIDQGISCRILPIENAKWVVYRMTDSFMALKSLISQISNLFGDAPYLKSSHEAVKTLNCETNKGEQVHFFFNPTEKPQSLSVRFPKTRAVGSFAGKEMPLQMSALAAITFTSYQTEKMKEQNGNQERLESI